MRHKNMYIQLVRIKVRIEKGFTNALVKLYDRD